ncbi:hypothetical protein GUJ93_ZPchr0006g46457 [Zizania palustris]|uniref:Uncharacterized protein n=1 Tax=Zizania palustris TaxID=103762 RepID=A0A8J5SZT5_ZIZPA|nr:hypothetical protein GUJ93_ZPchr0006g46457 [Zizania palustris]
MESHNMMPHRKLPVQKSTLCSEEIPATPSKNGEIYQHENKDTPQLNPYDYLANVHVLTPIIQTSFEAVGISRNTDPWSGQTFSGKRKKLLKLATKTLSVESSEFLQRRSEIFADIMQRLGANMIKKQHKESMRMKMVCGHTPGPRCRLENVLDYSRSGFDSLIKLSTGKESSCNATREACQLMPLPWGHNQILPSSLDQKINLPHRGNDEVHECMALPWVHTASLSSFGWKSDTAHNQVSNLLLEGVQPHTKDKPISTSELNCNVETRPCDYYGWEPMLSTRLAGSIPNSLSFPCQIEEKHVVPYAISNNFCQPNLRSPLEQWFSSSVGLEGQGPKEAGFCHNHGAGLLEQCISSSVVLDGQGQHEAGLFNSDTGLLCSFDQLYAKCTASSFLDTRNGILDHNDSSYDSNASESNNVVLSANGGRLNSIFSISEHPFQLGSKRLDNCAVHMSSLAGVKDKYSAESWLFDSSDIGPMQGLDKSPAKFTATIFSNYTSGILDHHHLRYMSNCTLKDNISTLFMDEDDICLNSLSSYPDYPSKQDGESLYDSSTELWSSVHHFQSYGDNLGTVLGFMSDENIYNDLEDHCSAIPNHARNEKKRETNGSNCQTKGFSASHWFHYSPCLSHRRTPPSQNPPPPHPRCSLSGRLRNSPPAVECSSPASREGSTLQKSEQQLPIVTR